MRPADNDEIIELHDNEVTAWLWWDLWPVRLLRNLLDYGSFILPVALFIIIAKRMHLFEHGL